MVVSVGLRSMGWTNAWFSPTKLLALLTLTAIVLAAGHPLLSTGLRAVDDHEYLTFRQLNPSGSFWSALLDALHRIKGDFYGSRWRPLYHLGRSFTTALIFDAALPRYVLRLVLTVFAIWGLATRIVDIVAPALRTSTFRYLATVTTGVILFTVPDWKDVSARLGPQELFALAGLTLCLLGLRTVPRRRHNAALLVGVILMSGFKENFAVLASTVLIMFLSIGQNRRQRTFVLLGLAISVSSTVVSYSAVRARGSTDIYGNDRSIRTTVEGLLSVFESSRFEWTAVLFLLLFLVVPPKEFRTLVKLGLALFAILAIEWLFYGETMNAFGRYALVSDLVVSSLLSGALIMALAWAVDRSSEDGFLPLAIATGILLLATPTAISAASKFHDGAHRAALEAESWSGALDEVLTAINRTRAAQLLVLVDLQHDPGRYEKSHSLVTFLGFYSEGTPDIYLAVQGVPPGAPESPYTSNLRPGLEKRSAAGDLTPSIWRKPTTGLKPLADLAHDEPLLCVHYSTSGRHHTYTSACTETVRFTQ